MRYTDTIPPQGVIEARPNWVHAYSEEGRTGQDETTIRPQGREDVIATDTDYTVGDVWFSDGSSLVALMWVVGTRVKQIEIYENDRNWTVAYTITKAEQERLKPLSIQERIEAPATQWEWACSDENDSCRLPIRFCTRLDHISTGVPISGKILADGSETVWDFSSDPI